MSTVVKADVADEPRGICCSGPAVAAAATTAVGVLESAGIVITPSAGTDTTAGSDVTVTWAIVCEPLSIITSIAVATTAVTVCVTSTSLRNKPRSMSITSNWSIEGSLGSVCGAFVKSLSTRCCP